MAQWVHRLSHIDPEARTAICASCGPVRIRRKKRMNGSHGWRCSPGNPNARQHGYQQAQSAKSQCNRCGFVPEHPRQLDVHHIDGNHGNNSPNNLEILCANCHRLVHG